MHFLDLTCFDAGVEILQHGGGINTAVAKIIGSNAPSAVACSGLRMGQKRNDLCIELVRKRKWRWAENQSVTS